jgi:phosphoribosylformylglycinamidine synthase
VDGIAEACSALSIPITGGNVSFYNDTLGQSIYPTPVLGVLGLLEDASRALGLAFRNEGDAIVLLDGLAEQSSASAAATNTNSQREFSSSEYAFALRGIAAGAPPAVDLAAEQRLIETLLALAAKGLLHSAHDISDGGLAVTVAESCFASKKELSAEITLPRVHPSETAEAALFGERGARAIVSCAPEALAALRDCARQYGVQLLVIGRATRGAFRILWNGRTIIDSPCDRLRDAWAGSLKTIMTS